MQVAAGGAPGGFAGVMPMPLPRSSVRCTNLPGHRPAEAGIADAGTPSLASLPGGLTHRATSALDRASALSVPVAPATMAARRL